MQKQKNQTPLTDFSDRELLQLMVISFVQIEKRTQRIENFLSSKFGKCFNDFEMNSPESPELQKTIIDYHDSALEEMESI